MLKKNPLGNFYGMDTKIAAKRIIRQETGCGDKNYQKWARIKEVEILEGHVAKDHIHLWLSISPKYSVY